MLLGIPIFAIPARARKSLFLGGHRINGLLKRNEKDALSVVGTVRIVRKLGRTVGVGSRLKNGRIVRRPRVWMAGRGDRSIEFRAQQGSLRKEASVRKPLSRPHLVKPKNRLAPII
ncbi:hypothetical protein CRI93_03355 [Longimonas halophila]|uniref:Uncharacterized protein n=1 Tax=Longimonas halophila TaxID=1469170 RepID=A0A2H3NP55_9BACT|nr:hypothetical protein CRI93_03355 [Longimonas halophila]